MTPQTHELKTWPDFFERLLDGTKTFEVRKDDRGFHVGDTLVLKEWRPTAKEYTGRELRRLVSYVMSGPSFGLMPGYVVMGLVVRLPAPVDPLACLHPVVMNSPTYKWCYSCGATLGFSVRTTTEPTK